MKRFCFALDLKDDEVLIAEYEQWHTKEKIWPEIVENIQSAGIINMEIYRLDTRMFMIMETEDDFSFVNHAKASAANVKNREWEDLMWKFQQPLPSAKAGEKWLPLSRIFDLSAI